MFQCVAEVVTHVGSGLSSLLKVFISYFLIDFNKDLKGELRVGGWRDGWVSEERGSCSDITSTLRVVSFFWRTRNLALKSVEHHALCQILKHLSFLEKKFQPWVQGCKLPLMEFREIFESLGIPGVSRFLIYKRRSRIYCLFIFYFLLFSWSDETHHPGNVRFQSRQHIVFINHFIHDSCSPAFQYFNMLPLYNAKFGAFREIIISRATSGGRREIELNSGSLPSIPGRLATIAMTVFELSRLWTFMAETLLLWRLA